MTTFLETLINGLAVGSLYALIALGYTMVYGILKFINFAHSDVFVVGAWVALSVAVVAGFGGEPTAAAPWLSYLVWIGLAATAGFLLYERVVAGRLAAATGIESFRTEVSPPLLIASGLGLAALAMFWFACLLHDKPALRPLAGACVLLCSMLTCGLIGFVVERCAYRPLRGAPRLNVLITAIGVSLLLQNAGQLKWVFGPTPKRMPELFQDVVLFTLMGVPVRLVDAIGAGTAVLLMLILEWLVFRTKLGRAMRAVSFNHKTAALMGVPVDQVISFTFVLGSMLAAAAGFLYALKYPGLNQPAYSTWVLLGLKAFVAAVVGGIGNVRGAMLGGIFIGLIEFFGVAYVSTDYREVYVFSILILVLLFRPSGLLGKATVEKV